MALTTRTITNVGDEIVDTEGNLISGETITFRLVLSDGSTPADVWDTTTHERIVSVDVVTTITAGIFTPVDLWPNSRGSDITQYLCTSSIPTWVPFLATLADGVPDVAWYDFFLNGEPTPGAQVTAFQAHVADVDIDAASLHHTLGTGEFNAAAGNHVHGTTTVANGGTGRTTGTTAYALVATGTTATGAQQSLTAGATTEVLVGGGAAALPVWTAATGSGAPVRATSPTLVTPVLGTPASGTLTNCTTDGTNSIGFKTIPQITKVADGAPTTGADLTYAGKHIYHTSTAGTFTIPANSSIVYPIGTALTFINGNGAGILTIAITSDTLYWSPTGATGSRTLAANCVATAIKVTSTSWIITGTGLA